MKNPGMRGKTEASTTRSLVVPWTRKSLVRTPPLSRPPIGHVHDAWWPHVVIPRELFELIVSRIGRPQRQLARSVVGVGLEHGPGEDVTVLGEQRRVARHVALEES